MDAADEDDVDIEAGDVSDVSTPNAKVRRFLVSCAAQEQNTVSGFARWKWRRRRTSYRA